MSDRYVALLRGVNVGRAKRVAMADLRLLLTDLGYTAVRTLLNSGNAIFDGPEVDTAELSLHIEETILTRLHVSTQVVVLTAGELAAIVEQNPLLAVSTDPSRLMVSFRMGSLDPRPLEPLLELDWSPEALALGEHADYLWCPAGVIESPLAKAAARAVGDIVTTTRNWATVTKLQALVDTECT